MSSNEVPKAVSAIFERDFDLLFGLDRSEFDCIQERIFTVPLIRDSQSNILDLPSGVVKHVVDVRVVRKSGQHWFKESASMMQYGNTVVPLKTHVSNRKEEFKAYEISPDGTQITRKTPLNTFLIDGLPDEVLLTRVLSSGEVNKYLQEIEDIGSTREPFWSNLVHAAVHNITSEFIGREEYPYCIGFLMERGNLAEFVGRRWAMLGTYEWLFKNRRIDSPFPFEVEVKFTPPTFPRLLATYKRWSEKTGETFLSNPFYHYQSTA